MWANATVHGFAEVAIHAVRLETDWEVALDEPSIKRCARAVNLPLILAIVLNVIDGQEPLFSLSAAGAYATIAV